MRGKLAMMVRSSKNAYPIRTLLIILAILTLPVIAHAAGPTFISGGIIGSNTSTTTIWSTSGSPYIITGDVTVRATATSGNITSTLQIDSGVVVSFQAGTGLFIGENSIS